MPRPETRTPSGRAARPARSASLRDPAAAVQVTEHEQAAAVLADQFQVTPPDRPIAPPAVLDEPVLEDRVDAPRADPDRDAGGSNLDLDGARPSKSLRRGHSPTSGNGARTALRSGSLDSGSTSSTRIRASSPAARRTCLTASPSFARRSSPGSSTSVCWSCAGGPNASTSSASDSAGAGRSPSRSASASFSRPGSALAWRSGTLTLQVPPSTKRADSASLRSDRPRRSRRASTRAISNSRPRSSCGPDAASGSVKRSSTGSSGRRGSSRVSCPCASSSASRPGCPKRSAIDDAGSDASSPSVRIPSRSSISGSDSSPGRVRRSPTGSGARNGRTAPAGTIPSPRLRTRVRRATAYEAKRVGAAPIRIPPGSRLRTAAMTPSRWPPCNRKRPSASKYATPPSSDSTAAPSASSRSSTALQYVRVASGSGAISRRSGQRDSASPTRIPATIPNASAAGETSPMHCERPGSGANASGSAMSVLLSPPRAAISGRRFRSTQTTMTEHMFAQAAAGSQVWSQPVIEIKAPLHDGFDQVLTDDALAFLAALHDRFDDRRRELLARRAERRGRLAAGEMLDFLPETEAIREGDWQVAPAPPNLQNRRVEITGPTERKMVINALNSGAKGFMADFEDANSPTWENMIGGQINLTQAINRELGFTSDEGKAYELNDEIATLLVRPRGWHLAERHLELNGRPLSGSLVDFGLYFFRNAKRLLDKGAGPYFYLPKMESHLEARLWNDVFTFAQEQVGIDHGTIKATVLIETFPAAFEMEEILYELRDHSAGLNAGRWDYIFSVIKSFRERPEFVLPDRAKVTMTVPFMRAYTELLVRTCHRRGAHAMGGMAALIPSRRDPDANERALAGVRADKQREAGDGFDGTWVAHPDLVETATAEFDAVLGSKPNQVERQREDVQVGAAELLDVPSTPGEVTEEGVRNNVQVGIEYIASWLEGNGAVAINNLMEDAATAEISRSQIWQWTTHGRISPELVRDAAGDAEGPAYELFEATALADNLPEFLTLPAYERLNSATSR